MKNSLRITPSAMVCAILNFVTPAQAALAVEPLHSVSLSAKTLRFGITSNGCSKKAHFDFILQRSEGATAVTVVRKKYDGCRRKRRQVEFEYSLREIGLQNQESIVITNSLTAFREPQLKSRFSPSKSDAGTVVDAGR